MLPLKEEGIQLKELPTRSTDTKNGERMDFDSVALRRRLEQEGMARLAEDLELDNGFEGFSDVLGLAPAAGRHNKYKLAPLTNRDANTTDIDEHNLKHLRRYVARRRKAGLNIPEIITAQIQDAERRIIEKGGKVPEDVSEEEFQERQGGGSSKAAGKARYSKKDAEDLGWLVLDRKKHYVTR